MAEVVIGGDAHKVSLPNFVKLEATWPYIEEVVTGANVMASVRCILGIVAVGEMPDGSEPAALTPEAMAPRIAELAMKLKPVEIPALRSFVTPLLVEVGLAAPPGEQTPAEEGTASPSAATSTPSSATSSPASDQPTGT